jgi:hypothetical protein
MILDLLVLGLGLVLVLKVLDLLDLVLLVLVANELKSNAKCLNSS